MVYNPPTPGQDPWGDQLNQTLDHLNTVKSEPSTAESITGVKTFTTPAVGDWTTWDASQLTIYTTSGGTSYGTYDPVNNWIDAYFTSTSAWIDVIPTGFTLLPDTYYMVELKYDLTDNAAQLSTPSVFAFSGPNDWYSLGATILPFKIGASNKFVTLILGPGISNYTGWDTYSSDTSLILEIAGNSALNLKQVRIKQLASAGSMKIGTQPVIAGEDGSLHLPNTRYITLDSYNQARVLTTFDIGMAKGNMLIGQSYGMRALPVGANGYVLTADSATEEGVKWAPAAPTVPANIQRVYYTGTPPARPTGTTYVEWVGPQQPTSPGTGDTWIQTQ